MNTEKLKEEVVNSVTGYWKDVYNNAPEGAKEYYRVNFAITRGVLSAMDDSNIPVELEKELYNIYHTMDDACWRYVLSMTSGPSKLGLGKIWKSIRIKQGKPFHPPVENTSKE